MQVKATPGGDIRSGTALHVGCGFDRLPGEFFHLAETRLDIDPNCGPDIVASMTDLGEIGPFDLVYSSHCLEHLAPHEAPVALGEFRRVLKLGGAAVIMVPDLEGVSPDDTVLFESAAGPICGLDLYYGHRPSLQARPFMAHRTGFVAKTLQAALQSAGFAAVAVRRMSDHNLLGCARK